MKKAILFILAATMITLPWTPAAIASSAKEKAKGPAIVLASFGTTVPSAVKSIININGISLR